MRVSSSLYSRTMADCAQYSLPSSASPSSFRLIRMVRELPVAFLVSIVKARDTVFPSPEPVAAVSTVSPSTTSTRRKCSFVISLPIGAARLTITLYSWSS